MGAMKAAAHSLTERQMVFLIMNTILFQKNVAAAPTTEPFTKGAITGESFLVAFFGRMQENGVDNIELTDFIFCSFVIMCAFELLNFGVKRSGCK